VEKPKPSVTPLPASALFHFAFPTREYAAIKAAVAYFAEKLRDPREKDIAQRALAMLESPTGLSLPSVEGEGAGVDLVSIRKIDKYEAGSEENKIRPEDIANPSRAKKGLAGLGGKK
jgi:hypothetical protein